MTCIQGIFMANSCLLTHDYTFYIHAYISRLSTDTLLNIKFILKECGHSFQACLLNEYSIHAITMGNSLVYCTEYVWGHTMPICTE